MIANSPISSLFKEEGISMDVEDIEMVVQSSMVCIICEGCGRKLEAPSCEQLAVMSDGWRVIDDVAGFLTFCGDCCWGNNESLNQL